jgi:simple sugar transport system ATP-binding protein
MFAPAYTPPPKIEMIGVSKRFGPLVALDDISMTVHPGSFHALLGGNGAGKSTLVKCLMGYYLATEGKFLIDGQETTIKTTRDARQHGIGMVYQHFTLVPNMTVAENLVLSRDDVPAIINWKHEIAELRKFMKTTPFFIPLEAPVRTLAAGQKQKLEIVKQLYLKTRVMILDEPTSVLTPQEADEVLAMVHHLTRQNKLSVLIITHKFREVIAFADECTILRQGKFAGAGRIKTLTAHQMAEMMIGSEQTTKLAARAEVADRTPKLKVRKVCANDDLGLPALKHIDLTVHAGEIVGIAGVSGNGQSRLVEVLAGQRPLTGGDIVVNGHRYHAQRHEIRRHKLYILPEEPLRNACVPGMSVGHNLSFRGYDERHHTVGLWFLNARALRRKARELIQRYRVKTPSTETPIRNLSGGNVQRAVLARELSGGVNVLIAANPCFGLDFAAVADIRAQIIDARNRGAAVLLVSEDLDEIFELSDRIVVMFHGELVYETPAAEADIRVIGRHMAGHGEEHAKTAAVAV